VTGSTDLFIPAEGDLPSYTLRVSQRAKHVRLTITPHDGLVVVVPKRLRHYDPSPVLRERNGWIESATARFAERRATFLAGAEALLPDRIAFAATAETWPVEYRTTNAKAVRATVQGDMLVLGGAVDDADACLAALHRWLQTAARERLIPILAQESTSTALAYARACVRGQRSRWGSCSSSGAITLNRCLLFLEPELVRAVARHELAHLVQPNHSAAFWIELNRLDPDAQKHRAAIRSAWDAVPPWAESRARKTAGTSPYLSAHLARTQAADPRI